MPDSFIRRALAGRRGEPGFRAANPIEQIPAGCGLPTLLVHGNYDGMVPLACSQAFRDQFSSLYPGLLHWHYLPDGTHLDAGNWGHTDNDLRRLILEWLEAQREHIP
jgi:hypothetical protein